MGAGDQESRRDGAIGGHKPHSLRSLPATAGNPLFSQRWMPHFSRGDDTFQETGISMRTHKIAAIGGDGIGPEVISAKGGSTCSESLRETRWRL